MSEMRPLLPDHINISNPTLMQIIGLATTIASLAMAFLYRDLLFIYSAIVGVYIFVIGGAIRPLREEKKESPFKRSIQPAEEEE